MHSPQAIQNAVLRFPCGLRQPPETFRFSIDALLLAAFATNGLHSRAKDPTRPKAIRMADLGTGCGVVALAALLAYPRMTAAGIELQPALVDAARHNAAMLGLEDRFTVLHADLAAPQWLHRFAPSADTCTTGEKTSHPSPGVHANAQTDDMHVPQHKPSRARHLLPPGGFDLVTANPPYRLPGTGRHPTSAQREAALFESHGTLQAFIRAAAQLLRSRGRFVCIFKAERLAELFETLRQSNLEPKRLRCVHARAGQDALLVLVEACRGAQTALSVEPPLVLHNGTGPDTTLSAEAIAFCPFLARSTRAPA